MCLLSWFQFYLFKQNNSLIFVKCKTIKSFEGPAEICLLCDRKIEGFANSESKLSTYKNRHHPV